MKNVLRMAACGAVLAVAASTVPCMASAIGFTGVQDQEHHDQGQEHHDQGQEHRDYSNNTHYQQGNNEGYNDYTNKSHRKHHHKFKNNDDRDAYNSGYQQGYQGQRGDHHDENPH